MARLEWRWLPLLVAAVALAVLWRQRDRGRRRPVAESIPLSLHVIALLAVALLLAAAAGLGLWAALGRPDLTGSLTPSPGETAWSLANTFDALKIILSVVAGIGGVVALTVAYRKQDHGEAAERRENTKLFNERFGRAAEQIGSDKVAVRLSGIYAMAGLADDWDEGRQTCINVLCAYLRKPYDPPADPAQSPPPDNGEGVSKFEAGRRAAREEQQVRQTVTALIREHLLPDSPADAGPARWHGSKFDFTGAILEDAKFLRVVVAEGTVLDFSGSRFSGANTSFVDLTLVGGTLYFNGAEFSDGVADFTGAKFDKGLAMFEKVAFSGGEVNFSRANFSGAWVLFHEAGFSGSTVSFADASFSGGSVGFGDAEFSGGTVLFSDAKFSGGATLFDACANFNRAKFSGGNVAFRGADFSGGTVIFRDAEFSHGEVSFNEATFFACRVLFSGTIFSGGSMLFHDAKFLDAGKELSAVLFTRAKLSGGEITFRGAEFSGGNVAFGDTDFAGGTVDFSDPKDWSTPPKGIDRGKPGVTWPDSVSAPSH